MKNIFQILTLFCLFSFFQNQSFAAKTTWTRHVLSEGREDGSQLLLVIDVPSNPKVMQNVVYRKIFPINKLDEFQKLKNDFSKSLAPKDNKDIIFIDQPVWPLKQNYWTKEDEDRFSKWVEENASEKMLVGGGIRVDCADFYIALRWIFAHDNGLPAFITFAASNDIFGSWMSTEEWQKLETDTNWKKDQRFKAALRYALNHSYTHSLMKDLYPVALSKEFVTPGAVNIYMQGSTGHTQPLTTVGPNKDCYDTSGCILSVWGNMPASETVYFSAPRIYHLKNPEDGGFMRYRWPEFVNGQWQLVEKKSMPGYSLEQFELGDISTSEFEVTLYHKLGLGNDSISLAILKGYAIDKLLNLRLDITILGNMLCHLQICDEDSELYEDYSTFSRDKRLIELQTEFLDLVKNISEKDKRWKEFKDNVGYRTVIVTRGESIILRDYLFSAELIKSLNSNPQESFLKRWAFSTENSYVVAFNELWRWMTTWKKRTELVDEALESCTQVNCDPRLNTQRLDDSMRISRQNIRNFSDTAGLKKLQKYAKDKYISLNIELCPWNYVQGEIYSKWCKFYDYLYSDHNMAEVMSPNPRDTYLKRVGF